MAHEPKEKPGEYARWLRSQEKEVEKSAKTIAIESAVKEEIPKLEGKLKHDQELRRKTVKLEKGLHQLILKEKARLRELKAWNGDEATRPRIRECRSATMQELVTCMFNGAANLIEMDISREVFGTTAKARKA